MYVSFLCPFVSVIQQAIIEAFVLAADLTYCDCEKIMQLLQNTEEGRARNIFGQYTAQHMRTWAALLRSYERDNLYVAEEARVLVNNTTYEMYVH